MNLLFDIGGTKTRIALSKEQGGFSDPVVIPTPQDFEEAMEAFSVASRRVIEGREVVCAAGGVPGPLNKGHTELLGAPNLRQWVGKPLRKRMEEELGVPVLLENDAAVVGLGEAVYGAGRGHDIVAYLTVSTGVGGARIIRGRVDENAMGFEPGHQVIDASGELCPSCGNPGDLEVYVSGSGVKARYGKEPYEIEDEKVWDELARWLAYGVNNTVVHWSPDVLVLGGSMMVRDPAIPLHKVKEYAEQSLSTYPVLPKIVLGELEDVGGLHGALALSSTHGNRESR